MIVAQRTRTAPSLDQLCSRQGILNPNPDKASQSMQRLAELSARNPGYFGPQHIWTIGDALAGKPDLTGERAAMEVLGRLTRAHPKAGLARTLFFHHGMRNLSDPARIRAYEFMDDRDFCPNPAREHLDFCLKGIRSENPEVVRSALQAIFCLRGRVPVTPDDLNTIASVLTKRIPDNRQNDLCLSLLRYYAIGSDTGQSAISTLCNCLMFNISTAWQEDALSILSEAARDNGRVFRARDVKRLVSFGRQFQESSFFRREILGIVIHLSRSNPSILTADAFDFLCQDGLAHGNPSRSETDNICSVMVSLCKTQKFRHMTERVWAALGLKRIEFADGGNGLSSVPLFMELWLDQPLPQDQALTIPQYRLTQPVALSQFAHRHNLNTQEAASYGRSTTFPVAGTDRLLVFKSQRPRQPIRDLLREIAWLSKVQNIGLKSRLPRPLENPYEVVAFDKKLVAIVFEAPRDYYRYLDDPSISESEFREGLRLSIHDVFLLARHGVYHTAPIAAFHNSEPGAIHRPSGDRGKYVIAPDIVFEYNSRTGMGRFDNWPRALRYGNFGVTGLRDFEELATLEEIKNDTSGRWCPELGGISNKQNAPTLYDALLLGNSLLAAGLYIGNRMVQTRQVKTSATMLWQNENELRPYAGLALEIFSVGYAVRYGMTEKKAQETLSSRADWLRLARQMAFFMTGAYAPFVHPEASAQSFPREIFGPDTKIAGIYQHRPHEMGPYRQGTFHPHVGFVGPDGNRETLSLGAVNGQFPIRELEKAIWAVMLQTS